MSEILWGVTEMVTDVKRRHRLGDIAHQER
jgi:hypothetical protein